MEISKFNKLIEDPGRLDDNSLQEIKNLVINFPYFQTAHMLYLKNLHNIDRARYERQIKVSGIQINDRTRFFHLLFDEGQQEDETARPQAKEDAENIEKETKEDKSKMTDQEKKELPRRKTKNSISDNISGVITDQIASAGDKEKLEDVIEYNTESVVDPASPKYKEKDKDSFAIEEKPDKDEGQTTEKTDKKTKTDKDVKKTIADNDLLDFDYDENDEDSQDVDLIQQFISNHGEGLKLKNKGEPPASNQDLSVESAQANEEIMTETLAKIYSKQGYFDKAIDVYQKLSLKYPEKSTYFANLIKQLEEEKKNNNLK